MNNNLSWLIEWFCHQSQGDWRRNFGILIGTMDNPGWYLQVSLNETNLDGKKLDLFRVLRAKHNWIDCFTKENTFRGYGGPFNFPEILQVFHDWTESFSDNSVREDEKNKRRSSFCRICGASVNPVLTNCPNCKKKLGIDDIVLEKVRKYKDRENRQIKSIPVENYPFFKLKNSQFEANFIWLSHWFYDHCNSDWEHGRSVQIKSLNYPGWFVKIPLEDTELDDHSFSTIEIERSELDWITCFVENGAFYGAGGPCNLPEILQVFRDWGDLYPEEPHRKLPHHYCRVCGLEQDECPWGEFDDLPTFERCDCCGTEFGCQDYDIDTISMKRDEWLENPEEWFRPDKKPLEWSYEDQMNQINEEYL